MMQGMIRAAVLLICLGCGAAQSDSLRFGAWGGLYSEKYAETLLAPFEQRTGSAVEIPPKSVHTGEFDVVEIGLHDAIHGCDTGQLMYLPTDLQGSSSHYTADFLPDSLQPCAIGQLVWSTVAVYNRNAGHSADDEPALIADFFNTKEFPGKRAIRQSPRVLAEWALVSSGVAPDKLYSRLSNENEAWLLIEKQLRAIESDVVWVNSDLEALDLVRMDAAAFAMVSSSSVVGEAMLNRSPGVIWDSAVQQMSLLAIPAKSSTPDKALQLIRYLTSIDSVLAISSELGLGSVRYSILRMMNKTYRGYLGNDDARNRSAITGNSRWWRIESNDLVIRFAGWVEKVDALQSLALLTSNAVAENE